MSILKTENLKKYYGTSEENLVKALDGVNLQVEEGEFAAIVGTSGSGKSTLLHMMGGLDRATEGKVFIGGKDIFSMKDEALTIFRRRHIGFVFQNYNLVPILNVYENVVLPMELDGNHADRDWVSHILNILGLADKKQKMPNQLSGGQQQRVASARALACGAPLILADEPTGSLDADTAAEIGEVLRENAHQLHKCVLAVTHSAALAAQADVVLSLEGGRLKIKNVFL